MSVVEAEEWALLRGGVRGRLVLGFMLASRSRSGAPTGGPGRRGVAWPESPEGGLSVHIFASESLSDSSPLALALWRRRASGGVNDAASGLGRWGSGTTCGARRLGRRKRSMNGLRSSAAKAGDAKEVAADEEGGRAKSEEDVGSDGRDGAGSGMVLLARRLVSARRIWILTGDGWRDSGKRQKECRDVGRRWTSMLVYLERYSAHWPPRRHQLPILPFA